MAKVSYNQRKKARRKRTISQQNQQIQGLAQGLQNIQVTLLAILAQNGGEIVVTQGTIKATYEAYLRGRLRYSLVPGVTPSEVKVQLIEDKGEQDGQRSESADEPTTSEEAKNPVDSVDTSEVSEPADPPMGSDEPVRVLSFPAKSR